MPSNVVSLHVTTISFYIIVGVHVTIMLLNRKKRGREKKKELIVCGFSWYAPWMPTNRGTTSPHPRAVCTVVVSLLGDHTSLSS